MAQLQYYYNALYVFCQVNFSGLILFVSRAIIKKRALEGFFVWVGIVTM